MRARSKHLQRWLAVAVAAGTVAGLTLAGAGQAAAKPAASRPEYQATIVRTAFGIPHITARNFGSLGYGYGFALASDDLCTMASGYITVEGQSSRYLGDTASNLNSDFFWQSLIDRRVIPRLLAVRTGPDAIGPQLRRLVSGYVAGYNRYLASVGGAKGVPNLACRGKPWVKPITALDAYLLIYRAIEMSGQAADPGAIADAHPPASAAARPSTQAALLARAASVARTPPGAGGLPSARQFREAAGRLPRAGLPSGVGSNAIAVGSAGTRDHEHGMLLGNPHFPWDGVDRFYEVQLTIPGVLNVEGATLYGIPLVAIGFTSTLAWSETVSTANSFTFYQLALVPGHPTEYVYDGKPDAMTRQAVTVTARSAGGALRTLRRTLWSTRYGPVYEAHGGLPLPWTTTTAFALDDANARNFRFLNHFLATDEAHSAAQELTILRKYEGLPWANTLAADSTGHALYADILAIPDVTNAKAARCDTALGKVLFQAANLPVLNGSRPACAWGTDKDSAAPGILGPGEEPSLMRRDFTENSNDSFWLTNPAHPLTGFPRIIGDTGARFGTTPVEDQYDLRTRSALSMVMTRISGTDGLGPPGFTFTDMKNLLYSDIQYGATLVKSQLVSMCRSFPGGLAPTSAGGTIAVGSSCRVLAAWNGRENPSSRGAVLFRAFWAGALSLPRGPWSHPYRAAAPLTTPSGLNTASTAVQQAFGDALAEFTAAHLPYNLALGSYQFVLRNGQQIPLPGGPGDPLGEFNAIDQATPGADPGPSSSYIQVVTWKTGDPSPQAATMLTYSESDNPASPHYADQTELFSHRQWVTAYFSPPQVTAHAISTTILRGR
jgi:acyl-homoserine-lactone acylase